MPVTTGRVNCRNLFQTIHQAMINAGWQMVSSDPASEGNIYKSTGISGTDKVFVFLKDLVNISSNPYMKIGIIEDYTPNGTNGLPGTQVNSFDENCLIWNSNYKDSHNVDYIINVNKDRVIIFLQGMKNDGGWSSSLVYAGLPKRYDPNDKTACAGMAWAANGTNTKGFKVLKNRALANGYYYEWDYYSPARSYSHGGQLFFSPLFFGSDDEGPRGELDGLYVIEPIDTTYEFQHLDTFNKNGKNYIIITKNYMYNNSRSLPNMDYVMEI